MSATKLSRRHLVRGLVVLSAAVAGGVATLRASAAAGAVPAPASGPECVLDLVRAG